MTFRVRFTREAHDDLVALYEFLLAREDDDLTFAEQALDAIKHAIDMLSHSPFTCRKAMAGNSFLRELVIACGATGCVALFDIDDAKTITVLAVRHQREDDYH